MEQPGLQILPKIILSEFKRLSTIMVMSTGANVLLMTKNMALAYISGLMARHISDSGKMVLFKAMEYKKIQRETFYGLIGKTGRDKVSD